MPRAAATGTTGGRQSKRRKQDLLVERRGRDANLLRRQPVEGVPRAAALVEIERLFQALSTVQQDDAETKRELATQVEAVGSEELVRHCERDVRRETARCLGEVLRVFAPETPYTDAAQIRSIIMLFIEQIGTLLDSKLLETGLALLQRLAAIRAFMLIFDCDECDQESLIVSLLNTSIDVCRGSHAISLQGPLSRILGDVLGEAESLPKSIWITLIELLTARGRSTPAADLARSIFRDLSSRSASVPINDFLNSSLYTSTEDFTQLMQASEANHQRDTLLRAIFELYCIDPALVGRVLPNLQTDLQCSDSNRRQAITKCVGQMLAFRHQESSRPPLMSSSPLLFDRYLERLTDADDEVRLAAVDGVGAALATAVSSSEKGLKTVQMVNVARSVGQKLQDRCLDPCEEVRVRVVQTAAQIGKTAAGFDFLAPVLPHIFDRIFDKKPRVREVCISGLAEMYGQHALPAWTQGKVEDAKKFSFIPQLLCQAYSVFSTNRLGYTVQLEECLEEHVLGCGLSAAQRGLALAGLLASVADHDGAQKGLFQLLSRKRDGFCALRSFVNVRLRGTPVLSPEPAVRAFSPAISPAKSDSGACGDISTIASEIVAVPTNTTISPEVTQAVEVLARVNPMMEDRFSRVEKHLLDLKSLDLTRDRALWKVLDELLNNMEKITTLDMTPHLGELNEVLRRKHLEDLLPLLRRCLLSTWLLPDQVLSLLSIWDEKMHDGTPTAASMAAQNAIAELSKYFPEALMPHVVKIVGHLDDVSVKSVHVALRTLSSLGKHQASTRLPDSSSPIQTPSANFVDCLVEAVRRLCEADGCMGGTSEASSSCRKALHVLGLLPRQQASDAAWTSLAKILDWTVAHADITVKRSNLIALRLMSACLDWSAAMPGCPATLHARTITKEWMARARDMIHEESGTADFALRCAAIELFASAGEATELGIIFDSCKDDSLRFHTAVSSLWALRRGRLDLSTKLLQQIGQEITSALNSENPDVDKLLDQLQKVQKHQSGSGTDSEQSSLKRLKPSDKLRLCATLPTLFAPSAKRHRESAVRILQTTLVKAMRQSRAQQQPMIDYTVACFIHFLARVPAFVEEATKEFSPYTESSRIASLFVEALLRADQPRSSELACIVLKVTERMAHFVDREEPTSDKVHKAAYVLKYVVEKRCPDLGAMETSLQGVARGCMPRELFELGQVGSSSGMDRAFPLERASSRKPATSPALQDGSSAAQKKSATVAQLLGAKSRSPVSPAFGEDRHKAAAPLVPSMPRSLISMPAADSSSSHGAPPTRRLSFPSAGDRYQDAAAAKRLRTASPEP